MTLQLCLNPEEVPVPHPRIEGEAETAESAIIQKTCKYSSIYPPFTSLCFKIILQINIRKFKPHRGTRPVNYYVKKTVKNFILFYFIFPYEPGTRIPCICEQQITVFPLLFHEVQ
jgi:hypothetical protein